MMDLNTRICFITEKLIEDEYGFINKQIVEDYSCWSNRKVVSTSKEFMAGYTGVYKELVSFKVRNCKFIKEIDTHIYKIAWNEKTYNIIAIDDSLSDFIYIKGECIS